MREFNEFVEELDLIDLSCRGNCLSWYIGEVKSMRRLDRFIIGCVD